MNSAIYAVLCYEYALPNRPNYYRHECGIGRLALICMELTCSLNRSHIFRYGDRNYSNLAMAITETINWGAKNKIPSPTGYRSTNQTL